MSKASPEDILRLTLGPRLAHARRATDALFSLVRPEALLDRPIPERHRLVFYLGHLEAFDWNLLGRTTYGLEPFNETFDTLFAFGIDPLGSGLPRDDATDWPSRVEIARYVEEVRRRTDQILDDVLDGRKALDRIVFEVAIEHRLMHAETLAYMLHWLPLDMKQTTGPARPRLAPQEAALPAEAAIPAGTSTLGMPRDGAAFGWDNEFELTETHVPAFRIDTRNVTNRQFLEFVRSGAYLERSLWSDDDWTWRSAAGLEHPRFWDHSGGEWMLRTMFDVRPLPADWPAYVSHAEARAYARWAGKALPTEAQYHRAAFGTPGGSERRYPWGEDPPDSTRGNFDLRHWDPASVGSYPKGDSAWGVSDMLGNGWEWTSTIFHPFDGFERFGFYPGYSAAFFDGKHFVLKGGSPRTSACMLRRSFRNWFQPHYPHIYATFRCVRS
jgi:ergothioneine biosynthesis protein EgtB